MVPQEKIMIFGINSRNLDIEDVLKRVGKKVYAYVVPDGTKVIGSVDGILVKTISSLSPSERDGLILVSNSQGPQDFIFEFLKSNGFSHVQYLHRRFRALSVKERFHYSKMYDWNINVSVPEKSMPIKDMNSSLKIYVVTSQFDLHKHSAVEGGG